MLTHIGLIILQQFLHSGRLCIVIANGPIHCLKGELAGPDVTIHLQSYRLFWRILTKPDFAIGEAYMDGSLTIANDDLEHLMALLMANNGHWQKHLLERIGLFAKTHLAFWKFFNLPRRAKRNIVHHYDRKKTVYLTSYSTRADNILAAISIPSMTRLPMRKSPSWRGLRQSGVYSQNRKFWILAVGRASLQMRDGKCSQIFQ